MVNFNYFQKTGSSAGCPWGFAVILLSQILRPYFKTIILISLISFELKKIAIICDRN
jgi:hypothetical protein